MSTTTQQTNMRQEASDHVADMMYSACDFQSAAGHWLPAPSTSDEEATTAPMSQKRRAASPLESEPAKRARSDNGDDYEEAAISCADMLEKALEHVGAQRVVIERMRSELREERSKLVETEEERDSLLYENAEYKAKEETRKTDRKAEESRMRENMKATSKKVEEGIRQKWEQKLEDQKKASDEKYNDLRDRFNDRLAASREKHKSELQTRDAKHKKERDELIAKTQKEVNEMKQKASKTLQDLKRDKEDLAQLKKDLREEQQAEIRKHKPETAEILKEIKTQLKQKQSEIKKLQDAYGKLKAMADVFEKGVETLSDDKKDLETIIATNKNDIEILNKERQVQDGYIETLLRVHEEEKTQLVDKLKSEGQKWQIQHENALESVRNAIYHQRACFDLKNANARRDKQIEKLAADNESLKAKLEDAEAENRRLSVDIVFEQKGEVEVAMTEADMDFVNGLAEKSIEKAALKDEGWMGADSAYDLA
ncbi:hypothetical protein LTR85_002229 [Meristemomyces frigidus]|nr:hypothetical protein LTR85_002229 [Meristemomyces frigidus]